MSIHTFLFTVNSSHTHSIVFPSPQARSAKFISSGIERIDQMAGCNGDSPASSVEQQTVTEKKFGGIAPKKPLISKDHERAYFDSADWVLGKQSASNSAQAAAIESLKPKLKRTPHHQLPPRKPACASS